MSANLSSPNWIWRAHRFWHLPFFRQRDEEALSWFVDDMIVKRLYCTGMRAVNRVGGVSREMSIALDPIKLQGIEITSSDISRQLRHVQQESAGGRAYLGKGEQPMRTLGNAISVKKSAICLSPLAMGHKIRLEQLAKVSDSVPEPRALALQDGHPVVGFEVTRSRGAGEVEVEQSVQLALEELKNSLSPISN